MLNWVSNIGVIIRGISGNTNRLRQRVAGGKVLTRKEFMLSVDCGVFVNSFRASLKG